MFIENSGQICGLEVFPHEFRSNNSVISAAKVIGITSLQKVQVTLLEPFYQIFTLPRPYYMKPVAPPVFSWDEPNKPVTDNLNFVISWDITIFLLTLKLQHNNSEHPFQVSLSRQMYVQYSILYSTFISSELLWVLNERKEVYCLHLHEFKQEQKIPTRTESSYEPSRRVSIERNEIYQPRILFSLQQEVIYHALIKDPESCPRFCYHIGFFPVKSLNKIYYISHERFQMFTLDNFKTYVKKYSASGEWLPAMRILANIYKGKYLSVAGVPCDKKDKKEAMRDLICETAINYIMINHATLNAATPSRKVKVEEISRVVVEFLLKTKHLDFLFDQVQLTFKVLGFWEEFIASLEPFILLRKFR